MHHATLVVGIRASDSSLLSLYLEPGLDVHHITLDTLTIEDVRALISRAELRPVSGDVVTFVIVVRSIHFEAQHALLKVLEEPPAHVQLFIVLPKPDELLATVRSRLNIVTADQPLSNSEREQVFQEFKALPVGERVALIGVKTKDKDTLWIDSIIEGTEVFAHTHRDNRALLTSSNLVSSWRGLRGASAKMLLEELALSLPHEK